MDFTEYETSLTGLVLYPDRPGNGYFQFRVSTPYIDMKDKLEQMFGDCWYAVYEHENDNEVSRTHIHGFCLGYDCKSPKTFRKRFYDHFKELIPDAKHDYAVGELGDKPVEYCSKGRLDPKVSKGFSKEWLDWYKGRGYDGKKDRMFLKDGKIVVEKDVKKVLDGKKRKTRKELIDGIVSDLGKDIHRLPVREIGEVIRRHLVRNTECVGIYKVADMYDSVMMYGAPDKWLDNFECIIEKRFSKG